MEVDKGLEKAQVVESNVAEKIGDMADKVVDFIKEAVADLMDDTNFEMDAPKGDLDNADKMEANQDSVKSSEQERSR